VIDIDTEDGDPADEAFEQVTWQFEGTLTIALDELLAEPA
jgi:hypothetical protein